MAKRIDRNKVAELVAQGLSDEAIAEQLQCSPSSVRLIRTMELGIKRRKGRPPSKPEHADLPAEYWIIKEKGIMIEYLVKLSKREVLELIKQKVLE